MHEDKDIILIQETNITNKEKEEKIEKIIKNQKVRWNSIYNNGREKGKGTMVIAKEEIMMREIRKKEGRYQKIQVQIKGMNEKMIIQNIYAPVMETERRKFYKELKEEEEWQKRSKNKKKEYYIIAGDFNCVEDRKEDTVHGRESHEIGSKDMKRWTDLQNTIDPWRIMNPEEREFTSPKRESRIDKIMISEKIFEKKEVKVKHRNITGADHMGIEMEITDIDEKYNKTPWRLQRWTIETKEFEERIGEEIRKMKQEIVTNEEEEKTKHSIDKIQKYESGIKRIQRLAYEIQAKMRKKRKREIEKSNKRIEIAKALVRNQQNDEAKKILRKQVSIKKWQIQRYHGQRQEEQMKIEIEEDEKCSHRFFQMIKGERNYNMAIPVLEKEDGKETKEPGEILNELRKFWGRVKNSPDTPPQREEPAEEEIRKLTEKLKRRLKKEEAEEMETKISAKEIKETIKNLKHHKASGRDGIIAEFYQKWKDEMSEILEKVYEEIFNEGDMPERMKETSIRLLYKKGKKTQPGNYRPIALLNIDYKILTAVLTRRVRKYLDKLLHRDQTAFVKGRHIQEVIWRIEAIDKLLKEEEQTAYILSMDQVKAYDRVNWTYMHKIVEKNGFGENFQKWIRILYASPFARIAINGKETKKFRFGSGVHQGDPLSCALYVLTAEPMAEDLRDAEYTGIKVEEEDMGSITQFADDTNVLLREIEDTKKVIEYMNEIYEKAAGAKLNLNKNKTKIMIIGKIPEDEELEKIKNKTEIDVEDPKRSTRVLGIQIGGIDSQKENEKIALKKARSKLSKIQGKANTLQGRALMVKNQLYAVVNYIIQSTKIGEQTMKKIQEMANVVMTGRRIKDEEEPKVKARVNRTWQKMDRKKGGLGVYEIKEQIRPLRIKMMIKLMNEWRQEETNWTTPIIKLIERASQNLTKGIELLYWRKEDVMKWGNPEKLPPVWKEAIGEWLNIKKRLRTTEVYEYPIFSSVFEDKSERITENAEKLIDFGMRRIKDITIQERKEIIEEKIRGIGNKRERNNVRHAYVRLKKKTEQRLEEESKKPYGKMKDNLEIETKKGWKIARSITKEEKKKGAQTWTNKQLRANMEKTEKMEHPVKRYQFQPEPNEIECVKQGRELEGIMPTKTVGVHEKIIFREYPVGRGSTEQERQCIHCGKYESIEHMTIECKVAKRIWKEHLNIAEEIIGKKITNRDIIIGSWQEEEEHLEKARQEKMGWLVKRVIWASIRLNIIKELWSYRNNKKYEDRWEEDEEDLRERIFIAIERIWKSWERMENRDPESDMIKMLNRQTRRLRNEKQYPPIKRKKPPDK